MTNRFYKITNPKEKQFIVEYVNLDDISSVHLLNESMNLGIVVMKTGKDIYVHKEELDKIISCLTVVNTGFWYGKLVEQLSSDEFNKLYLGYYGQEQS